jgi:hypothetical protein
MVDDQSAISRGEQLAHANDSDGGIIGFEVYRAFFENVVLNFGTWRQLTPHSSHLFLVEHQFDFRKPKLIALGDIFA